MAYFCGKIFFRSDFLYAAGYLEGSPEGPLSAVNDKTASFDPTTLPLPQTTESRASAAISPQGSRCRSFRRYSA